MNLLTPGLFFGRDALQIPDCTHGHVPAGEPRSRPRAARCLGSRVTSTCGFARHARSTALDAMPRTMRSVRNTIAKSC